MVKCQSQRSQSDGACWPWVGRKERGQPSFFDHSHFHLLHFLLPLHFPPETPDEVNKQNFQYRSAFIKYSTNMPLKNLLPVRKLSFTNAELGAKNPFCKN